MQDTRFFGKSRGPTGFTLVELLVVIAVIAILTALTLYGAHVVMVTGERSRATTEIAGISSGLEAYKSDNGAYPLSVAPGSTSPLFANTATYTTSDGTGTTYQESSEVLFQALTGKYALLDPTFTAGAGKSYMTFKPSQLGNATAGAGTTSAGATTYIQDPFGYSYGYSTGDGTANNPPYNSLGNFDLWSTGGTTISGNPTTFSSAQNWITNWKQ